MKLFYTIAFVLISGTILSTPTKSLAQFVSPQYPHYSLTNNNPYLVKPSEKKILVCQMQQINPYSTIMVRTCYEKTYSEQTPSVQLPFQINQYRSSINSLNTSNLGINSDSQYDY
jgi:hypothetical protein